VSEATGERWCGWTCCGSDTWTKVAEAKDMPTAFRQLVQSQRPCIAANHGIVTSGGPPTVPVPGGARRCKRGRVQA